MKIMLSTDSIVEKYLGMALENEGVPFNYNDTKFINIKSLYDFITDNHKDVDTLNFEEVLKEVIDAEEGTYEIGAHETKTGNPATINFEVEYQLDEDDNVESTTITF